MFEKSRFRHIRRLCTHSWGYSYTAYRQPETPRTFKHALSFEEDDPEQSNDRGMSLRWLLPGPVQAKEKWWVGRARIHNQRLERAHYVS
jgi:hypothetical protein